MNIDNYLKRINFLNTPKADLATLKELQHAHYCAVPYENFDILLNKPLSLSVEDVYEKVVNNNRGGYCFELNGLFLWLLREIGFNVEEKLARFLLGEEGIPMGRHRVLIVKLPEGDFLTDVGIGCPTPTQPIKVEYDKITEIRDSKYKLVRDDTLCNVLKFEYSGEWKAYYSFSDDANYPSDFEAPSFYCEHSPKSIFNKGLMVNIFTQNGRKTFEKGKFVILTPNNKEEKLINSPETLGVILTKEFSLKFNENELIMLYSAMQNNKN